MAFYYDLIVQVWSDDDGYHYAVGQSTSPTGADEVILASGLTNNLDDALAATRHEVGEILAN